MARHSPAKAHRERTLAAQRGDETTTVRAEANQYELMLAKLADDKRRLKAIQSIEAKAKVKADLLPEYLPWVEGVLAGDQGVQDDVLMTVMVWSIDAGDLALGRRIGAYAIRHQLAMPDQYQRSTGALLAEETADAALKALEGADRDRLTTLLADVCEVKAMVDGQDMHDQVLAKLHKAIGYVARDLAEATTEPEAGTLRTQALDHLKRALALHDKVGVKKDIEQLERAVKNSATAGNGSG